jgi:predicted DCC family thiol-disulfide oxidoreductase YuxK
MAEASPQKCCRHCNSADTGLHVQDLYAEPDHTPLSPLTLYHDGDCPLCAREIQPLNRHANAQRLLLIDIGSEAFQADCVGIDTLINRLHARFADGQWVTGLDATLWSCRHSSARRNTTDS